MMVTSLRRVEIVIGKILPYLAISIVLILVVIVVAGWHFHVAFHQPFVLAIICLLFLLCSLGLGLLISAFSRTQTQAIQLSVFFLLPIFVLSGAFAPPGAIAVRHPDSFGMLSANPLLPGFSARESLSGQPRLLQRRSDFHGDRSARHFCGGGRFAQAHSGIMERQP
jgi:ABC-type transport system involved in multi-copper enzyme maturation permease subunit